MLNEYEIATIGQELAAANNVSDIDFARAIESAVLAKLREQNEPVAWADPLDLAKDGNADTFIIKHASEWHEGLRFKTPLYLHPVPIPEGWKPLTDVQWMNIVNHDHVWQNHDKEEAINEVVKMVESKLRDNNSPMAAARSGE